jgi:hypothetical protein
MIGTGYSPEIVWREDIENIDYVRPIWARTNNRRKCPPWPRDQGRLVGYETLPADVPADAMRQFPRRIFILLPHDRDSKPNGIYSADCPSTKISNAGNYPSEAVDPRTIAPGKSGHVTPRVRFGKLPKKRRD